MYEWRFCARAGRSLITAPRSAHMRPMMISYKYCTSLSQVAHRTSSTNMSLSLPIIVASASLLYLLWKLFRNYLISPSVDYLPQPPPESWLFGRFPIPLVISGRQLTCNSTGIIPQLVRLGRQNWKVWVEWADTYGPVFIVKSILGVSTVLKGSSPSPLLTLFAMLM